MQMLIGLVAENCTVLALSLFVFSESLVVQSPPKSDIGQKFEKNSQIENSKREESEPTKETQNLEQSEGFNLKLIMNL